MKVIIVGAGIGGLTTYHSLRKHLANVLPTIKIYEAHLSPTAVASNIGGGLGIAPNGLRAISSVCPDAVEFIKQRACSVDALTFRNSSGQRLGRYSMAARYAPTNFLMMRRADVHWALLKDVPSGAVTWGLRVQSLHETADGVQVQFEDGSSETADLVIGADGVRSVVQRSLFGDKYPAMYEYVLQRFVLPQ